MPAAKIMPELSRRAFLSVAASGLTGLGACALSSQTLPRAPGFPARPWSLRPEEKRLIYQQRPTFDIVVREGSSDEVLRKLARPVPPGLDLDRVAARMERTMREAGGVGIAGPQVGLPLRIATLKLDYKSKQPRIIFVRNPVIVQRSDETIEGYEGCLSVPGVGGMVRRHRWIKIQHTSPEGEVLSTTAEGYNAVLWQHELDHLDGILYLDKLLGELLPMEEVRRRRKLMEQQKEKPPGQTGPVTLLLADDRDLAL
jgi:peptide deformylase